MAETHLWLQSEARPKSCYHFFTFFSLIFFQRFFCSLSLRVSQFWSVNRNLRLLSHPQVSTRSPIVTFVFCVSLFFQFFFYFEKEIVPNPRGARGLRASRARERVCVWGERDNRYKITNTDLLITDFCLVPIFAPTVRRKLSIFLARRFFVNLLIPSSSECARAHTHCAYSLKCISRFLKVTLNARSN